MYTSTFGTGVQGGTVVKMRQVFKSVRRGLWTALITPPPILAVVLNSALVMSVEPAWGHSKALLECKGNHPYKQAKKVKPDEAFGPTGLLAEFYDTDGDKIYDVVTLSHTSEDGKSHRVNPLFWVIDLDKDGENDVVYIDPVGEGKCSDIKLYEDMRVPHLDTGNDHSSLDKGRTI